MRSSGEYHQNNVTKRGIVVDRDPSRMKVKVNFDDEDETVSMWVDVLSRSSGSVKTFMMPNMDDEVWCMMDAKGEDGCVVGSKYNDKDTPPSDANEHITLIGPFGTLHIDGSNLIADITGNINLKAGGDVTIEAGGEITTSQGGKLTNNGKNVGHDHKHIHPPSGTPVTGEPE